MHGIPFSVKDNIELKGMMSTVGCVFLNKTKTQDAVCILPFLQAGALPIVRGSTPQAGLNIHTANFIWGEAKNYFDTSRSCGGSSGGDAGLV